MADDFEPIEDGSLDEGGAVPKKDFLALDDELDDDDSLLGTEDDEEEKETDSILEEEDSFSEFAY